MKLRDAAEAERTALSSQIRELHVRIEQTESAGEQELQSLRQELTSKRGASELSDGKIQQLQEQLERCAKTETCLAEQLHSAKRQNVALGLEHEVGYAQLEKTFKDQADQRLKALLTSHKQELLNAR